MDTDFLDKMISELPDMGYSDLNELVFIMHTDTFSELENSYCNFPIVRNKMIQKDKVYLGLDPFN